MKLTENNQASESRYFEVGETVKVVKGLYKGSYGTVNEVIMENIGDISNFTGSDVAKVLYKVKLFNGRTWVYDHKEVKLMVDNDNPVAYQINMIESYGSSR